MNKTLYVLFLFFGLLTTVKAQHCSWDNCYVIALEVRDSLTNELVNDLDIVLTDSSGNPYTSEWNLRNYKNTSIYQNTDTLKFGQNKGDNLPGSKVHNIPFGVGCYMLLVYRNNYPDFNKNETDKILINDNKGRYDTVSTTFDKNKISSMCTSDEIRYDEKKLDLAKIKIKIKRKK